MDLHLSPRTKRRIAWSSIGALIVTAAISSPILLDRFGPDRTTTQPQHFEHRRSITILGSGDILVHPPLWAQAADDGAKIGMSYDFDPALIGLRDVVSSADLALCHMEAPMGPGAPRDFPRFNAPIQLAKSVADIGFDGCSTASNHSLDQGEAGVKNNLDALDSAGLAHTGTARSADEAKTLTVYNVNSVKVGHLSYAYGINPGTSEGGKDYLSNDGINADKILARAREMKANGVDIVVVSCHWGVEKQHDPNNQQLTVAKKLLDSPDVDLIIGHHAHVVQPMEKINNKWVAYGVGNLIARHDFPIPANKEGILPRFTLTETAPGHFETMKVEAVPVWLSLEPTIKVINLADAMTRMSSADPRRVKYQAAYERIADYVNRRAAFANGLTMVEPTP